MATDDRSLRIALLTYRGKPHVGGQGIYVRHLAKALVDLGHHVEVFSGQPHPELDERVPLHKLDSLDIYNDHFPMRMPGVWELKSLADLVEVTSFSTGTFPEPLAFSVRVFQALAGRRDDFDLVHDNQSLGYGLLAVERILGIPLIATIHHPITVDRRLEIEHATSLYQKITKHRWYGFTRMQTEVARRLQRVITVSENSFADIVKDHKVPAERMHVVPVGVDPDLFKPVAGVERRPGHLITTASADVAMKGLSFLLEALAKLRVERPELHLTVIGRKKEGGKSAETIDRLGLTDHIEWVTGVTDQRIVELYSEAELAVVPSLYEGFSLPAIEAMSCGVPVVATTGGALPEVVGPDGETALLVPPGDADALASKIGWALDHPGVRRTVGAAGRERVKSQWSWRHTAERTVEQYRARLAEAEPPVLTVDYDRLKLEPGHLVLDMGAGAGRHAFEAFRRGARVVALDYGFGELPEVMALFQAMADAGEAATRPDAMGAAVNGDGTCLPFPDDTFDRIICSEVLEHIPDDEAALRELLRILKPGGRLAATVPTWFPEKICWRLSEEYHAPFVEGGHVRIFGEPELRAKMRAAGFRPGDSHHAHALHSPYWWLKCAVGPTNDDHPLVKAYHRLLVWDITKAPRTTRWTERVLNPVLGKSLVVYARKPVPTSGRRAAATLRKETVGAGA